MYDLEFVSFQVSLDSRGLILYLETVEWYRQKTDKTCIF